jgi:serine/threonine-protein kinase
MRMDEASASPQTLVGTLLDGKYRIEEHLGEGGMGSVYRARHVSLGSLCAIKLIRRELALDAVFVDRFQKEARLAARLRHPHLVALYDFARQADGTWYSVSELVVGETIAASLAKSIRFTGESVARLLGQVADGLALAHREGIVHRDISPDNIILTRDESGREAAKLLDFGIAKELCMDADGTTASGLLLGKIGYASPEQMGLLPKGETIDARTDVFSLSAVAYLMLTGGRLPWPRETPRAYIHELLVRPEAELRAAIERDLPAGWREVLTAGLARRREERTASVSALKEGLLAAARGGEGGPEPDEAARFRPPVRAPRLRSRRSSIVLATVGAAAAVVLAVRSGRPPNAPEAPSPFSTPVPTQAPAVPAAPIARAPRPSAVVAPILKARAPAPSAPSAVESDPAGEPSVPPPALSSLSITADVWMLVSVDGGTAEQTPFRFDRLAAGPHLVHASRDGYKDIRVEVQLRAGEAHHLTLRPERVAP